MNKIILSLLLLLGTALGSAGQVNHPPVFIGGATQTIHVCRGAGGAGLNSLLTVADVDTQQTVQWALLAGATHGVATVSYTDTTAGDTLVPTGLTYTPTAGFAGVDTLWVTVRDSTLSDTTQIIVFVDTITRGAVSALRDSVCRTDTLLLSGIPTGGMWSLTSVLRATITSGGLLTGIATGRDSVMYITNSSCGADTAMYVVRIDRTPDIGRITGYDSVCSGSTILLTPTRPGGRWTSSATYFAAVDASGTVTGYLRGTATITYSMTNYCGTATTTHAVNVNSRALPIIGSPDICLLQITPSIMFNLVSGGTWSSSNPLVAFVLGGSVWGVTAGTATITYTVNNACGRSTATLEVTVSDCATTGVNEITADTELSIAPNPANGAFHVAVPPSAGTVNDLVLLDATGKKVPASITSTNGGFDVRVATPGLYLLRVVAGNEVIVKRVVVE